MPIRKNFSFTTTPTFISYILWTWPIEKLATTHKIPITFIANAAILFVLIDLKAVGIIDLHDIKVDDWEWF